MLRLLCDCGCLVERRESVEGAVHCPACGRQLSVPSHIDHVPAVKPRLGGGYTAEPPPDQPFDQLLESRLTETPKTSGKAVASLVLGIASLPLTLLMAIPALIFGYRALGDISVSEGRLKGRGWAWAGIVLGWVGVVVMPVGLICVAIGEIREAAARMHAMNNMKQLGLAMHNYNDANGCFPTAYTLVASGDGKQEKPGLSWRVMITPYVESSPLYSKFNLKEPWDGPTNLPLAQTPYLSYQLAKDKTTPPSQTYVQVFVTAEGSRHCSMFNGQDHFGEKVTWGQIQTFPSNVILIAESSTAVPWTAPWDMTFDSDLAPQPLGRHFRAGSMACMVPCNVRMIPHDTSPESLKRLISRNRLPDERADDDR